MYSQKNVWRLKSAYVVIKLLCELKMKKLLSIFLLTLSCSAAAEWIEYSTRSNGDIYFFDNSRIEKAGDELHVWTRIRYKTSVMAASSYQSLIKLDCTKNSETVLQDTFYTDKNWTKAAMKTNTNAKPEKNVSANSASALLVNILCKD